MFRTAIQGLIIGSKRIYSCLNCPSILNEDFESWNCGKTGHYARMCRMRQPEAKQNKRNTRKKVNVVHPKSPRSSSEDESEEEIEAMLTDNRESARILLRGRERPKGLTFKKSALNVVVF